MEVPKQMPGVVGIENGMVAGMDQFRVEDLLDFSNDDGCEVEDEQLEGVDEMAQNSAESTTAPMLTDYCSSTSAVSDPDPHSLEDDLCVPTGLFRPPLQHEDIMALEWLSRFVEDSDVSSHIAANTTAIATMPTSTTAPTQASAITGTLSSITASTTSSFLDNGMPYTLDPPSPTLEASAVRSARTRRSRGKPCDWSSRIRMVAPSDPATQEASPLPQNLPAQSLKKPTKNAKKRNNPLEQSLAPNPDGHKCLHCATDKTPQWRTGPMGPKTLCNACGVRYKSGRLVPEYRPASSPTFKFSQHSNSHRKVVELRRQKEMLIQQQRLQPQPQPTSMGLFVTHPYQQTGGGFYDGSDHGFLIHEHLGPDIGHLL